MLFCLLLFTVSMYSTKRVVHRIDRYHALFNLSHYYTDITAGCMKLFSFFYATQRTVTDTGR